MTTQAFDENLFADIKLEVKNTSEIDWFAFETRMRAVINQMIEPQQKRQMEERSVLESMKKQVEEIQKKADETD